MVADKNIVPALFTSSSFASAAAAGKDWREISKAVLGQLQAAKTADKNFNVGFIYISDFLVGDANSIISLFRSVLGIDHWIGASGIGVCANGEAHIDVPAISAMIGSFKPEDFCVFPANVYDEAQGCAKLKEWLEKNDPMLTFIHADPLAEEDPAFTIKLLEQTTGGFLSGGLSSSRSQHAQFAGEVRNGGISGIVFTQNVPVATTLSQGCTPIGKPHVITRSDDHVIEGLDSEKALKVFETDIRSMAIRKIDVDPDTVTIGEEAAQDDSIPEEFKTLFKGEVHAAFPVSNSDQNDYLVRNIISFDPEDGSMTLSQNVANGETIMFVHRDDASVQEDLSKSLLALRARVKKDNGGVFAPKAAIYVSCVARAFSKAETSPAQNEMRLIREIIGDVPLTGFYAGGEICNARLYGYTGILTLFL